jgi:prevent-host-death family protein
MKVTAYSVSEARRELPDLLARVESGTEEIVITRRGNQVARIVAVRPQEISLSLRSVPLELSDDFDEPLEDLWEASS